VVIVNGSYINIVGSIHYHDGGSQPLDGSFSLTYSFTNYNVTEHLLFKENKVLGWFSTVHGNRYWNTNH
jgi:hypothetical protein